MGLLAQRGIDKEPFRSKSWNEFTGADAPQIDVAITVCSNPAQEACPLFMGAPVKGHWSLPDPADVEGSEAEVDAAFEATWQALELRVRAMLSTRFEDMAPRELSDFLTQIGQMDGAA